MAGITHAKVSGVADGGDATLVRPSDWNAEHVGGPSTVTVDLSTADLLNLPFEVVPAQGAGMVIVPIRAAMQYHYVTEPFGLEPFSWNITDSDGSAFLVTDQIHFVQREDRWGVFGSPSPGDMLEASPDDADNEPLFLDAAINNAPSGSILTALVGDAGTGYAPGDTGTITSTFAGVDATYTVDTVGGAGEVLTFTVNTAGTGFAVGVIAATLVVTGTGDGIFTVNPDTITPLTDSTARLSVVYYVMELL